MKNLDLKEIIYLSLVAAVYVAMTLAFAPIAYGPIQFRFSEVLVLLALYKKQYAISLIIGVFIANLGSPLGWYDWVFGTLATTISIFTMQYLYKITKNKFLAALMPVVINAIIIGTMLSLVLDIPLLLTMFQVGIGQFVVIMVVGLAIFRYLERNEVFATQVLNMESAVTKEENLPFVNLYNTIALALVIIVTVLFYKSPMYREYLVEGEYFTLNSFRIDDQMTWLIWSLVLPILNLVSLTFFNKSLFKDLLLLFTGLVLFLVPVSLLIAVFATVAWPVNIHFISVLVYLTVLTLLFILHIFKFKNEKSILNQKQKFSK